MIDPRNCIIAALAAAAACGGLHAQEVKPTPQPAPVATPAPAPTPPSLRGKLLYKPPLRGIPAGRVDAGTRGDGGEFSSLYVLAPEHVGLTTRAQPTLFWYQTRAVAVPFELAILRENEPKPLLFVRMKDARRSGLRRLNLADHGIELTPGVEYQWVIALVRDSENRSHDIVSSGWIKRVAPLPAAPGTAEQYAAEGLWYDALQTISDRIDARPREANLQALRADLLTQVGLDGVLSGKVAKLKTPAK